MHAITLLPALVLVAAVSLPAQYRKEPPVFDPNDSEGILVSPNPQIRTAWKRKVHWKISNNESRGAFGRIPPQTAAERQQMTANLNLLAALFKATPNGSNGIGFWVNESRTLDYFNPFALPANTPVAPFPLEYSTGLFPFYHEDIFDNGKWRLSVNGETQSVYYYFNQLPEKLDQPVIASEIRGGDLTPIEFYLRPQITGRVAGLPLYDGSLLAVLRADRDPWSPAPLGRVLKAALPSYEKDRKSAEERLANLKKKNEEVQAPAWEQQMRDRFEKTNGSLRTSRPSNYQARLRSLEHEITYTRERAAEEANPQRGNAKGAWYWNPVDACDLAIRRLGSLPAEEAAKPACYLEAKNAQERDGRYAIAGSILTAGVSSDCRDIVLTNWSYFDLKLPRTTPQILTVKFFGRCAKLDGEKLVSEPQTRFDHPPQGCVQHAQMWRELDWSKFAALVQP